MDIILYNPLSRNGKNHKAVLKLQKRLLKEKEQVVIKSLLEIPSIEEYLKTVNDNARFIIMGGDGTLNNIANQIKNFEIEQDILMMRGGTGNDFARSLKIKRKLVSVKQYLYNLPKIKYNNQEGVFLNGVGLGLDGNVVYKVNESSRTKSKRNYFLNTMSTIKNFKTVKTKIILDNDVIIETDKTWFISVMNSKFFGGGMRIAPKANRNENDLDIIIVKKIPRYLILLLFPIIYSGLHVLLKRYIEVHKATHVKIVSMTNTYLQIDGEDHKDINSIEVYR